MSARYKYIVAAVAGVALLGGAAAFTWYSNTHTGIASASFEDGTSGSTVTTADDEAPEAVAAPVIDGMTDFSAPENAPETGLTPETSVPAETAEPAGMDETAPAPVTSETQPE